MQRRTVLLLPSNECGWTELRLALAEIPNIDLKLLESVASHQDALGVLADHQPDFVIAATRINGEPTLPLLREIHEHASPVSRIVLMTAQFNPDELTLMYGDDVGVSAHLQWRELHPQTLPHLLEFLIFDDLVIMSREVVEAFVGSSNVSPRVNCLPPPLTPRETGILRLMAEGLTEKEIAQALGLSRRTVERLVGHLERKLGARSQFTLALKAIKLGLID